MSSKKKDKKEKEKKEKDKTKIKLKHKPSKSKLIFGGSTKSNKAERAVSETNPTVSFASSLLPPRPRSTSIGVQRLRKSTDPESMSDGPTPDSSSMSNSEGKSPDVLRKAVAELAELENLIDGEIESDPGSQNLAINPQGHAPEDDELLFDATLDLEKKIDFLSQLADDFAMNLPEDVERAFEEVISALQTEGSNDILGLTEEKVVDDIDGADYDSYIDSIIKHTQEIGLDDDDFTFDMKIEGLDEYRNSLASSQTNELEQALHEVEGKPGIVPGVTVVHSPRLKPLPNLPESPEDSIDLDISPHKSPRPDVVEVPSSPRVLSPKKVTPTEHMLEPVSPSRVITPRQPSPRHSLDDMPQIVVTELKTPQDPEDETPADNSPDDRTVTPRGADTVEQIGNEQVDSTDKGDKIKTPREPESVAQPDEQGTDQQLNGEHIKTPRAVETEDTKPPTPRSHAPRRDNTPKTTPRQYTPRQPDPVVEDTPTEAAGDAIISARETPASPRQHDEQVDATQDVSESSDSDSGDSSDNESSSSEMSEPESPKADETRTASGSIKVPPLPVQDVQNTDGEAPVSTTRNSSAKTSRRGSALTAADKQKIIIARREATLKMAQQLRDELKSGTSDPNTKRQRLAQLLNDFKGVQVKGLINIFEQKMKEVVKK